ncbi:MAG TPA: hypothetical protein VIV11_23915, partial [Kofleriaceae bacterium]
MKGQWYAIRPTKQRLIGWALALITVLLVTTNQQEIGIARDETVYFGAASKYADWWLGLVTFEH